VINIHPSLLPAFKGRAEFDAALFAAVTRRGPT
jgi:folate-dependent phosphoribosylglycinamide formyltransferase PurN